MGYLALYDVLEISVVGLEDFSGLSINENEWQG